MRVRYSKILFLCVILAFIKFPFISQTVLRMFKLGIACLGLIYIFGYHYINLKRQWVIILFGLVVVLSSLISYQLGTQFFYGLLYAILVFELFVLAEHWVKSYGLRNLVLCMFFLLFGLCFVNDCFLLLGINFDTYVLGNKFGVAYYHLLLVAFFAMTLEKNSMYDFIRVVLLICLTLYCVFISFRVDTNTGMIGIIVFLLIYLLPEWVKKKLADSKMAVIILYSLSGTILLWDFILNMKFIQDIIVSILHRSMTLTGRLDIYKILYNVFIQRPVLGWGYETEIVRENLYGNAQNGIVHLAIQYGVIGVLIFTLLINRTFRNIDLSHNQVGALISVIYAFFVMATVEIVFSNIFFVVLAVLYAVNITNETEAGDSKIKKRKNLLRYPKINIKW